MIKKQLISILFFILVLLQNIIPVGSGTSYSQTITLISPNTDGVIWSQAEEIAWSTSTTGWAPNDTVDIELSADGGLSYGNYLARNLPYNLGEFHWPTTTTTNGTTYRIKVSWTSDSTVHDASCCDFEINNSTTGTAWYINDSSTTGDIYCTEPGNDSNNGRTPSTPKWNLQSVIDETNLAPGDVVYVDTGGWSLSQELSLTSSDQGDPSGYLFFSGSPNGSVFSGDNLAVSNSCLKIDGSDYVQITYFTAQSAPAHGLYHNADQLKLFNSTFTGNSIYGIYLTNSNSVIISNITCSSNKKGGLICNNGDTISVTDSIVESNGWATTYNGGIYAASTSGLNISDNILRNNKWHGIKINLSNNLEIYANQCGENINAGLIVTNSRDLRIHNNIIEDNGSWALEMARSSSIYFFNNFVSGNGIKCDNYTSTTNINIINNLIITSISGKYCLYFSGVDKCFSDYNLIYPTSGAYAGYCAGNTYTDIRRWILGTGQDGHSISENPFLVDRAGGDYHPQSLEGSYHNGAWTADSNNSPCLNAGRAVVAFSELSESINAGAVSIPLLNSNFFSNPTGMVDIEGDIISYIGIDGDTLTGCNGVNYSHLLGADVFQPIFSAYTNELSPNGNRINIGPYGNTGQASKSSLKSLLVTSPWGRPKQNEKWSGSHDISWEAIGSGWSIGTDLLNIYYSHDSVAWFTITENIPYDSSPFPAWNTASSSDSGTCRVKISHSSGDPETTSGIFILDNSPPTGIGALFPVRLQILLDKIGLKVKR